MRLSETIEEQVVIDSPRGEEPPPAPVVVENGKVETENGHSEADKAEEEVRFVFTQVWSKMVKLTLTDTF